VSFTFSSFSRFFVLAAFFGFSFPARSATPVILISVDTLRADHLGCYQPGRRQSPHIDALAKSGTLFSQVSTPFPLTLPAHVALFTSTYPFANGVQDNGIPLNNTAATLATVLKKAGYQTSAFVGSFVLDRRFGLSRGFDVYDGPLDVHNNIAGGPVDHKRPGDQVTEAAKRWIEKNASAPYFLFLHLYDLHAPYSLPPDPSLRHGETGYQAELAYVDKLLGDFFAFLERRGLFDKALIVFTSDHGEGLGEHGENSHGYFIYQSTLHVPLIVHWPAGARRIAQNRIDEPANLIDVAPTILDAVGLAVPSEMRGHSLMKGGSAEEVYSESVYARNHFGCAGLRSLRVGGYKYIDAPKPELYDLTSDPSERQNIYDQQRSKAAALRERIVAIRGNAPVPATPSPTPETAAALRSLGYLSGSSRANRLESHVDPKDRIADFERFSQALGLASAGRLAESDGVLEKLSEALPDIADIRMNLGLNRLRLKDDAQAANEFKRVIELDPTNAGAHFELGLCYFRQRQGEIAAKEFNTTLALEPWYTRADEALAEIYIQGKDFPQARAHLNHLLTIDPASYTAHFNLGIFAAMENNWDEAQRQIVAALAADPGSAEAHNTLGGIYLQRGELEPARRQFEDAIRRQPNFAEAHYRLGLVLQKQGKSAQAAQEFHAAQEAGR
jgi:arylsulfatase A-like enzyme/Tfp pilus assembly protein PilF